MQEKLLRVIEYGEYQRLGGEQVLTTDVRVVAATNVDLPARVAAGTFRADLLDRLAFDVVTLPPLRARPGDISLLADHFARRMAIELREDFPGFAPSAIAGMEAHDWPGNVRELRNFAQRLAAKAIATDPGAPVRFDPAALDPFASPYRPGAPSTLSKPAASAPNSPPADDETNFDAAVRAYETRLIDAALAATEGHQGKAAARLSLTYDQFRGLLRKHGYGKGAGKPQNGARRRPRRRSDPLLVSRSRALRAHARRRRRRGSP